MRTNATVTVRCVTANGKTRTRRFWGEAQPDGSVRLPNGIRVRP